MLYKVSDISEQYEPGEEVVGIVEADTPRNAILKALKGISPSVNDMFNLDPDGFIRHVLPEYEATIL